MDFLRETRDVTYVSRHLDERGSIRKPEDGLGRTDSVESRPATTLDGDGHDGTLLDTGDSGTEMNESDERMFNESPVQDNGGTGGMTSLRSIKSFAELDRKVWIPGQGVRVDYAAIIEILIQQLDNER